MPVRPLLLAGLAGLLPWPAMAAAPAGMPVDTSALSYYASRHDTPRVDAELRRLRSLYPNWQPPADPASLAAPDVDAALQPLWDLFAADKLDELDAALAARKAEDASFQAPTELVDKLAAKRARLTLIAAADRQDYARVIDIAAHAPDLVRPDDLAVSWSLADAYGRAGDAAKALRLDQTILQATADPATRLATVRKAMAVLSPDDLKTLLDLGRKGPDGRSEFDAVDIDLVRQRIGKVLAGSGPVDGAAADAARLEASARSGSANDAALLGWLASKGRDWGKADAWFQLALASGPAPAEAKPENAKVAQGAVLALRALGKAGDAETLAYRWHEADPAIALLYIDGVQADLTRPKPAAVDEDRLKRFGALVASDQSGDGAQALGWYAYNIGQFQPARAWFEKAFAWQPRDSTALGLALSLKQLGDRAALTAFVAENGPTFASLASLAPGRTISPDVSRSTSDDRRPLTVRARRPKAVRPSVTREARREPAACASPGPGQTPATALQSGWCLMSLDRPREAAMAFAAAGHQAATAEDAAYGQALANLRTGRVADAVAAAGAVPLASGRRQEIGLAALAQAATTSFDQGRYDETLSVLDKRRLFTPEPRDLTVLRGWSTYHLDDRERARTIFSMLDRQLSTSETRAGLAATEARTRN